MPRFRGLLRAALPCAAAVLLTACPAPFERQVMVVTSLPMATPPPAQVQLASGRETISPANAGRVAALRQIGKGRLTGIALSPDGKSLAVASTLGVRFYDPQTLRESGTLETGGVDAVAYVQPGDEKQGATLATASGFSTVLWDVSTGLRLAENESPSPVLALATSPRSSRLAVGLAPSIVERPDGFVSLLRAEDLAQLRSLPDSGGRIMAMAQNSDGSAVVVAAGKEARVWPLASDAPGPTLRGHTDLVTAVAYGDGNRIVTAGADGFVRVWDGTDGRLLQSMDAMDDSLSCVAVSPGGELIAAGSASGGIHVWDAGGNLITSFHARPGALRQIVFTPDGSGLLTAGDDQTVARWQTSDWRQIARKAGHLAGVYDVAFSPSGDSLVTTAIRHGLVDVWRVADGELLDHEEAHDGLGTQAAAFAPDGSRFATGGEDNLVRLWTAAGMPERNLAGHRDYVTSVAISPDSSTIASGSYDKTIRLWRASDGKLIHSLEGHDGWVNAVAFSPDGRRLLSTSYDRTARLWDVGSGKEVKRLEGFSSDVTAAAYSPSGDVFALGVSAGGEVRLYDADGAQLRALEGGGSEQVTGLTFSPDGAVLAASYYAGTPVRLWNVADGSLLAKLDGARDLFSITFSPDGRLLAGASGEGVVNLWGIP